jgi:hypothetical protein
MVNMAAIRTPIYQGDDGLERAVIDLVRVGAEGHAAGVRQLASRLMRAVPASVKDADEFRHAVHHALSVARPDTGLRFDGGAIPADAEGTHPLAFVDPLPQADELVLDGRIAGELEEIVIERERANELAIAGVPLTRTVLFSGAPGVGKTLTARWLAWRLGLPLVVLDLAAVVSSYLGSSGRNIKSVLDYAKSGPCVLLLDEFDAVAKRRDDESDIGELKRIVNVILVELDRWPDTSLLVAATNHPQLLDSAIDRRFDRVVEFPMPGQPEREAVLKKISNDPVDAGLLAATAAFWEGGSFSDVVRFWETCRRRAIVRQLPLEDVVLHALLERPGSDDLRHDLWRLANERYGFSHRKIAAAAGLSHPTVSTGIRRAKGAA